MTKPFPHARFPGYSGNQLKYIRIGWNARDAELHADGVAMPAVTLPLYQAAQWNMAVQCAEREPHKQVVLEGRTVLAVHAKLTAGVPESLPPGWSVLQPTEGEIAAVIREGAAAVQAGPAPDARTALEAALPVLQDYASSNPMHFYRGAWQDPRGVHAAVKLVTAALGVRGTFNDQQEGRNDGQ